MVAKRTIAIATLLFTCAACANPVVVPPVDQADVNRGCAEIAQDIEQTRYYRDNARADDRFMMRYILVVNAGVSVYRMHKAQKAAEERLAGLEHLYREKGCGKQQGKPAVQPVRTVPQPAAPIPRPAAIQAPAAAPAGNATVPPQSVPANNATAKTTARSANTMSIEEQQEMLLLIEQQQQQMMEEQMMQQ